MPPPAVSGSSPVEEPVDAELLSESFALRPAPDGTLAIDPDERLRAAIWEQIRALGLTGEGAVDLRAQSADEVESLDVTRVARMCYGLGYSRLLEIFAQPPPNYTQKLEVGKLALAFIRHTETNDRDTLKLNAISPADRHFDRAIEEMQAEVVRVARLRLTRRKE